MTILQYRVDAQLARLLSEGYRSSEAALKELVDNAWDADAETVRISLPAPMTQGPIVINDDGSSTIMEPGGGTFVHPNPATMTLTDYDPSDAFVRGTIEGTYFTCYGAQGLGTEGDCDTYTVNISFTATNTNRR